MTFYFRIFYVYFTLSFVGNPLHMNLNPVSDGHDQIIEAQAEHHTSQISDFFFLIFIYLFIYLLAALGLRCCAQAFSSCGERGLLHCGAQASHCGGPSCCRAWALGAQASVVVAHGLSCSTACGIVPDQGLNPCPLHWQADS